MYSSDPRDVPTALTHPLAVGGTSLPYIYVIKNYKHSLTYSPHGLRSASCHGPSDAADG